MKNIDELTGSMNRFNCVLGFQLDIEPGSLKYNLILTLGETEEESTKKLIVYFYDIDELFLSGFGGGLTQFMHLKIVKDQSGHDRKNYRLSELEYENIHFAFTDFDILS